MRSPIGYDFSAGANVIWLSENIGLFYALRKSKRTHAVVVNSNTDKVKNLTTFKSLSLSPKFN